MITVTSEYTFLTENKGNFEQETVVVIQGQNNP